MRIDLNADLGEGFPYDEDLLALVTSANIACGAHAGDRETMRATIRLANARGVAVGAHPGFFDRENFGRRELALSAAEIFALVANQLDAFSECAREAAVRPQHVKPHGALYNMAVRDSVVAGAIAGAIASRDVSVIVFAPAGSCLAQAAAEHGLRVAAEFFADRNYQNDGSLVPRSRPDALLHDGATIAERVIRAAKHGLVRTLDGKDLAVTADTVCLHGDTPDAVAFARELRAALEASGARLCAVG